MEFIKEVLKMIKSKKKIVRKGASGYEGKMMMKKKDMMKGKKMKKM